MTGPAPRAKPARRPRKRKFSDPGRTWAKRLERYRPGLVPFVLEGLAERYGHPTWQRRLDPTSELILTILTQNSADTGAEVAFEALRSRYPGTGAVEAHNPGPGWGGVGLPDGVEPDWGAVEFAPLPELVETIWPGGLGNQKAPRIQATLRQIREERGDYSLEFLGDMPALEARAWLTQIDGIGKKTASVLLLFSFGLPLLPIDRHVDRVLRRVGTLPPKASMEDAHDLVLGMFAPDQTVRGTRQPHPARPEGLPRPAAGPRGVPVAAALPVRGSEGALTDASAQRRRPVPPEPVFSRARSSFEGWCWQATSSGRCPRIARCRRRDWRRCGTRQLSGPWCSSCSGIDHPPTGSSHRRPERGRARLQVPLWYRTTRGCWIG